MTVTTTPIVLDTTLYDLYRVDNETASQPTLIFAPFHVHQHGASTQFIYHAGLRNAENETPNPLALLRLRTSPQRHAFAAGKMSVVVLTLETEGREAVPMDKADIQRNLSLLPHDQQPAVTFWTKPEHIALKPGALLALSRPTDCLSHLPHLIDPEVHYEILSKRGLALSGLPSPRSTVIDTLLRPQDMPNPAKSSAESARMMMALDTYKIPFVVKLPQSAGKGTFIVSCDAERVELKEKLRPVVQVMLEQVTQINHHLYPCSLVLQDFIEGTVVALSLFVTRAGRPIFIACCKQSFNENGHWAGGSISYTKQDAFRQLYAKSVDKVALFLHQKGYYGPAGIDILTTASGEQYIIDLNVRITGTFNLGLVAGHFKKRGMGRAVLETAYFSCSRATFEESFAPEIQEGRIVITAWTHDDLTSLSYAVLIIGGRSSSEIKWLLSQVQNYVELAADPTGEC